MRAGVQDDAGEPPPPGGGRYPQRRLGEAPGDSLFVPHGVVLEEAGNGAQDLGLPAWWLNEQLASTSQARTTRAGAAYSTIPACG